MGRRTVEGNEGSAFIPSFREFRRTRAGQLWLEYPGWDLFELVSQYGLENVAHDAETGTRSIQAWMQGTNQPQPDSLYRLMFIHPEFSCDKTILRCGFRREIKGNMKRTLEREPMGFAAMDLSRRREVAVSRGGRKVRNISTLEKEKLKELGGE
tara:strand:+ start:104 stop:565 length:462 start_codon:yes stop_codon:yes gene_type:complete